MSRAALTTLPLLSTVVSDVPVLKCVHYIRAHKVTEWVNVFIPSRDRAQEDTRPIAEPMGAGIRAGEGFPRVS